MSRIQGARLSRRFRGWVFLAACVTAASVSAQSPQAIVTRCGSDVDAGGMNLTQALAAGGNVTFRCGGPATIKITKSHSVDQSVFIDGGGNVTLDGGGTSSFLIATKPTVSVQLQNVTVSAMRFVNGASVARGAISVQIKNSTIRDSASPLDATKVVVENGQFENNTGVVIRAKSVLITNSAFKNNKASPLQIDGGEATITDSTFDGNGESVIENCPQFAVTRANFTNNTTLIDALLPGAALRVDCPGEILNSAFTSNSSNTDGGAVAIAAKAKRVAIVGSRFTSNVAQRLGGAVAIDNSAGAELALVHTIFKLNRARAGGAIFVGPPDLSSPAMPSRVSANAVTFDGNVASERGGALAAENVQITVFRGFFLRNSAPSGGAVWSDPATAALSLFANALFVLNTAGDATFAGRAARFANSTILGTKGAGLKWLAPAAPVQGDQPIEIANTIVENNSGGNCVADPPHLVAEGANLQYPGDSCGPGATVAPALLDTFYAPLIGGAARAKGVDALCANAQVQSVDAYGEHRPKAGHCSIGAVEGDLAKVLQSLKAPAAAPDPGQGHAGVPSARAGEDGSGGAAGRCPVTSDAPRPASHPSALLARLLAVRLDYSISDQQQLEGWLVNQFTPYPAIASALLSLFAGKALVCPVFIDVVVDNYKTLAGDDPRQASQVRSDLLATAVVEGFNTRHGAAAKGLPEILAKP
jgi:predicted outer membrane repeat protein